MLKGIWIDAVLFDIVSPHFKQFAFQISRPDNHAPEAGKASLTRWFLQFQGIIVAATLFNDESPRWYNGLLARSISVCKFWGDSQRGERFRQACLRPIISLEFSRASKSTLPRISPFTADVQGVEPLWRQPALLRSPFLQEVNRQPWLLFRRYSNVFQRFVISTGYREQRAV